MRITVATTLVGVIACLLLVGVATPEAAAQNIQVMSKKGPDLVIQEIIIREEGTAEFHNARVSVRVRNIGGADAGATVTALVYSNNAAAGAMVLTQATPAVAKGAVHEVEFTIEGIAGNLSGMLLAVADAPTAADPVGQVAEGNLLVMMTPTSKRIDLNNTFGAIFTTAGRTLPLRFQNPLVN